MTSLRAALTAEALGTFALVFLGCGSVVLDEHTGGALGSLGISLCFGSVVTLAILRWGPVSGAHINPAVSVAFWAGGHLTTGRLAGYVVVQSLAALAAGLLLVPLAPGGSNLGATTTSLSTGEAFLVEAILTAQLMLAIFLADRFLPRWLPVLIGAVVGTISLTTGSLTGASMNPARSLGPALASGQTELLWLYHAAPVAGALAAHLVWKLLPFGRRD